MSFRFLEALVISIISATSKLVLPPTTLPRKRDAIAAEGDQTRSLRLHDQVTALQGKVIMSNKQLLLFALL